ncbi:TRAP transporter small permease [Photobacterium sp. GJ3]|uniref:TRAP transporter small permease n=1 Tax=Photobacterium sp. GJ3 TaxID=2829502 RepID=UPI001B8CB5AB|nr:TRAP transporter small permease [Photobacterium sp. GJ3]QUJ66844.1 TRAP transporter small permease [Photobacterium sp. GJ3]
MKIVNFEKYVCAVVSAIMGLVLIAQVLSRYALNISIPWAEEVALFCMLWLAYFGSSIAIYRRKHIRITLITEKLPIKVQKIMELIGTIIFFIVCIYIVAESVPTVMKAYETNQLASASNIPRWIPLLGVPLAFFVSAIRLVIEFIKIYRDE